MTSFRTARLALLALVLAASCKSGEGGVADVLVISRVDVEPGITQVILGQSLQLAATPRTASGISVPGRSVTWNSSDPLIATVSNTGLVSGVALGGPVRIRATVDGVVGDALVTVRSVPVDRVTVTPANSGVLVAAGVQLTPHAFDATGNPLPGRSFDWASSDPAIAAVTTTGIVIGLAQGGPVTITASSEGKSGSALVSVATRPATRLAFAEQPGASVAGAPLTPPIRILLQDDLLTTVIGAANPVTISLAGNPVGATLGGTTTINATSGIATFNNLTLDRPGTGYTFLVTSPGLNAATSTPFNVAVGAPAKLAFSTPLPGSAQSGVAFLPQPVLQLADASGNLVAQSGVAVTAALASGAGTLSGTTTATTNSTGAAAFSGLGLSGPAGSYTVSFSAPNLTSITGLVTLGAGVAGSLAIAVQPTSSAQSGVALSTQPAIQLKDAAGNNVGQAGVVITASIASGTGTLGGASTATTNSAGLAQFASLAINGASGSYTLGFSAPGGITGVTSSTIVLGAGAPTQLSTVTQPSTAAQSGVAFATQPSVRLLDGGGNPVNVAGIQVTAGIASGGGTLSGATTATTNASGVATFTNLAISGTVGPRTLSFASAGLTSATSGTITLSAGPAAALGLNTQPSPSGSSGVALAQQPVVQVRDAAGNPVSQNGVLVTATIASGPPGATLGGNVATTAGFGAATFTSLAITGPSGTYTIQFSAPGLTAVTSGGVTLGAGAATQLFIATQPSSTAQSGAALAQQPQIQLRDASNNPVAQAGVVVTAAIASGGGTLGGTTTATTNASGLASFTNLSISGVIGARTLGFSAPGLAGATSGTITLSAGAASQLSISTQPSNLAQSGVPFPTQPVIQLRDAAGNAVSQAGTNVSAAIVSGGGTLGGTATVATNGSGVATFTGLSITGTAGDRTLSFSATGLGGATSSVVSVTAGAASNLSISTQPSPVAQSGIAFAQQPIIQLRDASNNPVSQANVVVTAAINSGGGSLGGTTTATTNASGMATFTNLSITGAPGIRTLLFAAAGYVSVASNNIDVSDPPATQLAITQQPVGGVSGAALATQPIIAVQNAQGGTVTADNTTQVSVAISSGAGGTLGGTQTVTAVNGIATFTNLTLSGTPGVNYVLQFTSSPALTPVSSGNVTVTAAAATQLGISQQPVGGVSGSALATQPIIAVQDAQGGTVTADNTTQVSVAISSGAGGTLGGTQTVTAVNGIATFTNLTLSGTPGVNYVLQFTSIPALTPVSSTNVTVTAPAATQLGISQQPVGGVSGSALATQPIIAVRDAQGGTVTGDNSTQVSVAISSGAGGTLGGTQTVTAVNGVASFTNLTLSGTPGVNYVLQFTSSPALTPVSSNNVTVTAPPASPAQLGISQQPVGGTSGAALATQPIIAVQDAQGGTVTSDNTTQVSVAISSGAGGTLGGTQTVTAVNGVASFTNLTLSGTPGVNYVLQFTSSPALTPVSSNNVTVTAPPASPAQLGISQQPVGGTSGAALATQPIIAIQDAQGGTVAGDNSTQVSVAISSGAGGTLGGTQTVTAVNGVASFTNLTLSGTPGVNYVLQFTSSPALTPVSSGNVTVTAPAATQLGISQQPVGGVSGAALATQPIIAVQDAQGGTVTSDNTTQVSVAISSGAGGTLGGTQTVTAVNGVASFTNLTLSGTPGVNYVLQFTSSPALTPVSSGNVTVTAAPAPATQLGISQQPVGGVSGAALATQPIIAVQDAQGGTVSSDNATQVSVAISSGAGGTLGGTQTVTAVNGVASFTNLTLSGTPGVDYVLQFTSSPALTPVSSGNVTVTAAPSPPAQLGISQQPVGGASGSALATQPIIAIQNGQGGMVTTDNTTQVSVGISSGAGGALGGNQTVQAASGLATFTNLTLAGTVGVNYVLQFTSSPALTPVSSGSVTVSSGSATNITITTEPGDAASGATLSPTVVQLRDANGNAVATSGIPINVALNPGMSSNGTLTGTLTVPTDASGAATFSDLVITGPGTYKLRFTSGSLNHAISVNFTIT